MYLNYLGWKIYFRKRKCRLADRGKLIRDFERRFQDWDYEEKDNGLELTEPEHKVFVTIRFGNFVTPPPSQQKYSIEIESRPFGHKRRQMRNHLIVLSRVLKMLPGKKEAYSIEKERLVRLDITLMKHFEDWPSYYEDVLFCYSDYS